MGLHSPPPHPPPPPISFSPVTRAAGWGTGASSTSPKLCPLLSLPTPSAPITPASGSPICTAPGGPSLRFGREVAPGRDHSAPMSPARGCACAWPRGGRGGGVSPLPPRGGLEGWMVTEARGLSLDQGGGQGDPLARMGRETRPQPYLPALARDRAKPLAGTQGCFLPSRGIPVAPPSPPQGALYNFLNIKAPRPGGSLCFQLSTRIPFWGAVWEEEKRGPTLTQGCIHTQHSGIPAQVRSPILTPRRSPCSPCPTPTASAQTQRSPTPHPGTALHHTGLHPHLSPGAQSAAHAPDTLLQLSVHSHTCTEFCPHTGAHTATHRGTQTLVNRHLRLWEGEEPSPSRPPPTSMSEPGPCRIWRAKTPAVGAFGGRTTMRGEQECGCCVSPGVCVCVPVYK